jgi:predicted branched-subunit amino acid permease
MEVTLTRRHAPYAAGASGFIARGASALLRRRLLLLLGMFDELFAAGPP